MDSVDLKIIRLLQEDNRRTYEELAELVGASSTACRRRVAALRKSGVIKADVSIIDPAAIGLDCSVIALVTLKSDDADAHDRFRRRMDDCEQVLKCDFVAGASDYVISIVLPHASCYDAFCERMITGDPDIGRCESLFVIKTTKTTTELPVQVVK